MNTKLFAKSVFLLLVTMVGARFVHAAKFDAYLKIDDIEGESQGDGFGGWSDILGYNISAINSGSSSGGGGGGAGKVTLSDMTIKKPVDKASPILFGAVLTGKHYKTATIDVRKANEDMQEFVLWEFSDVLVSSYSTSATPELLLDTLSLNYSKVSYSYFPEKEDGSVGEPVVFTYDKKTNTSSLTGDPADFQFVAAFGSPVPELNSLLLLGIGLTGIAALCRRRGFPASA